MYKNPRLHKRFNKKYRASKYSSNSPHLTLACPQAKLKRKQDSNKNKKKLNFPTSVVKER